VGAANSTHKGQENLHRNIIGAGHWGFKGW
jgi:hypothetical protein